MFDVNLKEKRERIVVMLGVDTLAILKIGKRHLDNPVQPIK